MLDRMFLTSPSDEKLFVEDCFATHLYTGNGSTQTITNGIDLAGKGGMVWLKGRSNADYNYVVDTARGSNKVLVTDLTDGQASSTSVISSFNSNGFSLGSNTLSNGSSRTFASWTFREAPKFFDVVTYTGTGSARTIAHSLGVAPGCIIVKRLDTTSDWPVYHRGMASAQYYARLNTANTDELSSSVWNGTAPTASLFSVGTSTSTNASGGTYVAYLFAHDAASDGIIQCGNYVRTGTSVSVNLGWEPQWVLIRRVTDINGFGPANWVLADNMRGFDNTSWSRLVPNTSSAETTGISGLSPNATGFTVANASGQADINETYIYIAIRRGPMKTPTSGTSVFSPNAVNVPSGTQITTNFPVDMTMATYRLGTLGTFVETRLIGVGTRADNTTGERFLNTTSVSGESTEPGWTYGWNNTGFLMKAGYADADDVFWSFRRAPGFFDEVCYTGTGVARTLNHNLGVAPELMIVKRRDNTGAWQVYSANLANTEYLVLNTTAAKATGTTRWNSTTPTSTVLTVGTDATVNASGGTYVAYLFASCPGVSKVGSFTGNGSSQTINCGFSAGARFVLIKRTDSTGDWYVWDTARGMVAANDPHLSLNSAAAEVTTDDSVDTDNTGFIVNQVSATNVNVNGASYIYLAIA